MLDWMLGIRGLIMRCYLIELTKPMGSWLL